MPTAVSKLIAIASIALAFSLSLWHGWLQRTFDLDIGKTDLIMAIAMLSVLLTGALCCIVSITRANYRLIKERDLLIEKDNENAEVFSRHSRQIKELESDLIKTGNGLHSLRNEYQAFNNRYDELLAVYKKLIEQIKTAGLEPVARSLYN